MNSDEEYRLKWWLSHYKNAGRDLAKLVQALLDGKPYTKEMLSAQLPAYIELFEMELEGVDADGK
jgi:hypothetical protein